MHKEYIKALQYTERVSVCFEQKALLLPTKVLKNKKETWRKVSERLERNYLALFSRWQINLVAFLVAAPVVK